MYKIYRDIKFIKVPMIGNIKPLQLTLKIVLSAKKDFRQNALRADNLNFFNYKYTKLTLDIKLIKIPMIGNSELH